MAESDPERDEPDPELEASRKRAKAVGHVVADALTVGPALGHAARFYMRPMTRNEALIGGAVVLFALDVAFFLLGRAYYIDKVEGALIAQDVPNAAAVAATAAWVSVKATFFWAYFVFSTVGTLALTAAVLWPRQVAHGLAAMFGGLYLLSAIVIFTMTHMPPLVGVFQAVIGGLMLRLAWATWKHKDRAAWAFLLSLSSVLAIATLFGAPRMKAAMHVPGLWYVMTIPFVMTALALALYRHRSDYA